jgi:tetratricopeptide (TPR) repeat protein
MKSVVLKLLLFSVFLLPKSNLYGQTAQEYLQTGEEKFKSQNYASAIADLTKAIQLDQNLVLAYYYRAYAKENLKDFRGSLNDYNKAISLSPPDLLKAALALMYFHRGIVKLHLGDWVGSEQDYTKVIVLVPESAEAYFNRGLVRAVLSKRAAACLDYSKAGELGMAKAYDLIREDCQDY